MQGMYKFLWLEKCRFKRSPNQCIKYGKRVSAMTRNKPICVIYMLFLTSVPNYGLSEGGQPHHAFGMIFLDTVFGGGGGHGLAKNDKSRVEGACKFYSEPLYLSPNHLSAVLCLLFHQDRKHSLNVWLRHRIYRLPWLYPTDRKCLLGGSSLWVKVDFCIWRT